jgi:hypothetical protein
MNINTKELMLLNRINAKYKNEKPQEDTTVVTLPKIEDPDTTMEYLNLKAKNNVAFQGVNMASAKKVALRTMIALSTLGGVATLPSCDLFKPTQITQTVTIDFSEILDLNYLELIFRDFFIYAGFVAFIALIFYIGSLIIKKPSNYLKMVSIAATAIIPYAIGSTFVVPLLTAIWASLGSIASILITVYTVTIFIALINKEIKIKEL